MKEEKVNWWGWKSIQRNNHWKRPNLAKDTNLQIREIEWSPKRISPKKSMPRDSVIKLLKTKDKEKILNVARVKWHTTHRGTPMKRFNDSGFLLWNMEARWKWRIFQSLRKKQSTVNSIHRKLSSGNERVIKTFSDQERLRFSHYRPTLNTGHRNY